jgi:hypothetical protein
MACWAVKRARPPGFTLFAAYFASKIRPNPTQVGRSFDAEIMGDGVSRGFRCGTAM